LNPYDSFRGIKPDATIQQGVYVYTGQFPVPLAAALVEAHDAQKLISAGAVKEALDKASDAAKLAPGSAHVQSTLGDALVSAGNPIDGLEHYRLALHAAQTIRPDLQATIAADLNQKIDKLKALQPGP
jgi:thioredoxin-like negative regulator of GroEL